MKRKKGFHQGHGDFVGLKRHHRTIAADDLVMGQGAGGGGLAGLLGWIAQHIQDAGAWGNINLHFEIFVGFDWTVK
jgi:hypothetical protein